METIGQTTFFRSGPDRGPWRHGPYGVAVHCLQCRGTVDVTSLVGPGNYSENDGVSPHTMSDQRQIVELLGPDRWGSHIGSQGNPILWGAEVTGFAEWTSAQWADNAAAVRNQAKAIGRFWAYQGWAVEDLTWGSLDELAQARRRFEQGQGPVAPRLWPHGDVSKAIGGTTHWDPGDGYPYADLVKWAREWAVGGSPTVGADDSRDWFDTASITDLLEVIAEALV